MRDWNLGYAYAYYRASYFLAGRRVIPLVTPQNEARLERLEEAELIAIWQMAPPPGNYTVVWAGHGGALVRKAG
jgi:hypothetical protein